MHTSAAVFLAFSALYFASLAMPVPEAKPVAGWAAQGTVVAGAIAAFLALRARGVDLVRAVAVLAVAGVVSALAALAVVRCVETGRCTDTLPLHAVIFSTAALTGAAAYVAFSIATHLGMPLWAAIVASAALAPVLLALGMPLVTRAVATAVGKFA
jgi:hypothetical protein